MAIKRLTIEIDDATDLHGATEVPTSLIPKQKLPQDRNQSTTVADYEETEGTGPLKQKEKPRLTTGRTFPDLIMECINSPRAMATILMFAPVIVFVGKVNSLVDLRYPAAVGIGLNAVWFFVPWIFRLFNWPKQTKNQGGVKNNL